MRRTVVRYKVRPEAAEENAALVRAVYRELAALGPAGFRYATYRLEDGVGFVHVAEWEGEGRPPLLSLAAFAAFQEGIGERCAEGPVALGAELVGRYAPAGPPR